MAKVLRRLNQDRKNILHSPGFQHIPPVVWVDDLAVLVPSTDADSLVDKVTLTMSLIHNRMKEHGWQVNYKQGKTEVLLRFAGTRAARWRRDLHIEKMNQLHLREEQILLHVFHGD